MWVNEVFLDRRLTILFFCIFCYVLFIMGTSISFHWFFIFLTMVFNSFHCLYGTTESYNATLVERHGFPEKKRVPREKSGRHSNLIYLALNSLKKSGTAFSDFSLFSRCCSLFFQSFFIIFKVCWIIFHWFFNVVTCVSLFFIVFWVFVLLFTCIFCIFAVPYTWKIRDGRERVKNFGVLGVSGLNK